MICDDTGPRAWARAEGAGTQVFSQDGGRPSMSFPSSNDVEDCLRRYQHQVQEHCSIAGAPRWQRTSYLPGEFHPRIQRQGDATPMRTANAFVSDMVSGWVHPGAPMAERFRKALQSSLASSRELFVRMRDVFRYIEPDAAHLAVYGHDLRHLLILACTEVESGMKAVLSANGFAPSGRNFRIVDYHGLVQPMRLDDWELALSGYSEFPTIRPFGGWRNEAAPSWWRAHNDVKHDRENALQRATLQSAIEAAAAVLVVMLAKFGTSVMRELSGDVPFKVERLPRWHAAEFYIPPALPGGHDVWTELPLTALEAKEH